MGKQSRNKQARMDSLDEGAIMQATKNLCENEKFIERAALGALMASLDVGTPVPSIRIAIERQDDLNEEVLARLKADFKERTGNFVEQQVRDCVCLIQSSTDKTILRSFQERRRAIIRGFRETGLDAIWNRAVTLVRDQPDTAMAIYEEGDERSTECCAEVAHTVVGKIKGVERRYAAIKTRVNALAKELNELDLDVKSLDENRASLLGYLAAKQFGGARTLLVGVVANAITAAVAFYMALLITDDPKTFAHMVRRNIEDGGFDDLDTAIAEAATLPVWGGLQPLVEVLGRTAFEDWPAIAHALIEANGMASGLRDEFERMAKEARQQKSAVEKETAALMKRLRIMERDLAEAKKRAAPAKPGSVVPAPAAVATSGKQDAELAELRKTNARIQQRLDEQGVALANTRALLDSLINQPGPAQKDAPPMTEKDFREMKGVVVGGHINMINKLRKVMPNCLYYSADHRKIDEAAARDRDFMIFFTSHCNHSLSDNALRLSRLYEIPTGYSGHVNVDMFLKDVARVIGREAV